MVTTVKKILFICTGNSCRSVMAEGLMRHLLEKKGRKDVQVLSAGVGTSGGFGATIETVESMQAEGIDVSRHVGQPVTPELIQRADLIFCMEEYHRQRVLSFMPSASGKTHLLKTFESTIKVLDPNIADPIGRPKEVYESCLLTIKDGVQRIIKFLEKNS